MNFPRKALKLWQVVLSPNLETASVDTRNRLRVLGRRIDGKKHGRWYYFNSTGTVHTIEEYEHGERTARGIYDPAGRLVSETHFGKVERDIRIGFNYEIARSGKLKGRATKVLLEESWRGKPSLKAQYVNGTPHGKVHLYEDGILRVVARYKRGLRHGYMDLYDTDSRLRVRRTFKAGGLHGWEYHWNEEGRLTRRRFDRSGLIGDFHKGQGSIQETQQDELAELFEEMELRGLLGDNLFGRVLENARDSGIRPVIWLHTEEGQEEEKQVAALPAASSLYVAVDPIDQWQQIINSS